jgi:hypothetical protein
MSDLEKSLGIKLGVSAQPKKLKPRGIDIIPVRKITSMLNSIFYKKGNKVLEETVWYAFMPWKNNEQREWWILCSSIPPIHDVRTKKIESLIRKKYPQFRFKIAYYYNRDIYFEAREHIGTYL